MTKSNNWLTDWLTNYRSVFPFMSLSSAGCDSYGDNTCQRAFFATTRLMASGDVGYRPDLSGSLVLSWHMQALLKAFLKPWAGRHSPQQSVSICTLVSCSFQLASVKLSPGQHSFGLYDFFEILSLHPVKLHCFSSVQLTVFFQWRIKLVLW